MTTSPSVERLAAFTQDPLGGNPAGVVIDEQAMDEAWMQSVATDVGYSETAFAWPKADGWTVRYFSPVAEVPFCGHATIALGAVLAERGGDGTHVLDTRAGEVEVEVAMDVHGPSAALRSVAPWSRAATVELVGPALDALGWSANHLAPGVVPALAFAGARHLLLEVRSRAVLAALAYDFDALMSVMRAHDLTTVAALWQRDERTWHARNAFPVGGVVEDPATGAAAAAFGGWLRDTGRAPVPAALVVHQGEDMGRPSRLEVDVPATGGIRVAGRAVRIT